MIVTKHNHTTLTMICRHLAIKVTKTLDINVPGIREPMRPEYIERVCNLGNQWSEAPNPSTLNLM